MDTGNEHFEYTTLHHTVPLNVCTRTSLWEKRGYASQPWNESLFCKPSNLERKLFIKPSNSMVCSRTKQRRLDLLAWVLRRLLRCFSVGNLCLTLWELSGTFRRTNAVL